MELKQRTLADNQMEFAVIALEAAAKKMNVPVSEMYLTFSIPKVSNG